MKKLPVIILLLAFLACTKNSDQGNGTVIEAETVVVDDADADSAAARTPATDPYTNTLSIPVPPPTVTDPLDRLDYVAFHYWDAMDFRDTAMTNNLPLIQNTFSRFIGLLPQCSDDDAREAAIRECLKHAAVNPMIFSYITNLAEDYLYERESPLVDEHLYKLFINNMLASHIPTETMKHKLRLRRDQINKAAPGTPAPEITILFRDGSETRLTQILDGMNTLLVFYDAGSETDKEQIGLLAESDAITEKVEANTLHVFMLNTSDSLSVDAPPMWFSAVCDDPGNYVLRTSPSVYMIDRNGNILLKDMTISEIRSIFLE